MKQPDQATLEHLITTAMAQNDWVTVNDLEPRLDAVTPPRQPPPMVASALWYAEQGLRVFPLQPHLKIPLKGSRGCKDATTDRQQILWWFDTLNTMQKAQWDGDGDAPNLNLGIATGHLVDVIDIDGPEGVRSWAKMDNLPETIGVVSTPRPGGNHLYIRPTGKGNGAKLFPGIDYRGDGGYVCVPPSILKEIREGNKIKQYAGRYHWRWPLELP